MRPGSQRGKPSQQQKELKKAIEEADRKIKLLHRNIEFSHRRY